MMARTSGLRAVVAGLVTSAWALGAGVLPGCEAKRLGVSSEQLGLLRTSIREMAGQKKEELYGAMKQRVLWKQLDKPNHGTSLDVLVLSGGGEFGAFGTGFLQGWSGITDPATAKPEFDLVTGVSTGALIAPFAFVGDEENIRKIDELYAEAGPELATLRGLLFFLPWQESFLDTKGLKKRLSAEITPELMQEVARGHADGRRLLVGTTDLDLGRMHIFDMGEEAQRALEWKTETWFERMLLASAAIPGAFPPVEIEGRLYADGGTTEQFILGFDAAMMQRLLGELAIEQPDALPVTIRLWVIVNNKIELDPEPVKPSWVHVSKRSLSALMKYSMKLALYRLDLAARGLNALYPSRVELRWVSIPDDFDTSKQGKEMFDRDLMHRVAELGRRMGASPSSWRQAVPSFEWSDAIEPTPP